jgi:hypothetical protein
MPSTRLPPPPTAFAVGSWPSPPRAANRDRATPRPCATRCAWARTSDPRPIRAFWLRRQTVGSSDWGWSASRAGGLARSGHRAVGATPRCQPVAATAPPMAATDQAFAVQEVPHLPYAIGFPSLLMEDAHPFHERLIGPRPWTHRPMLPRIESTPTDLEHLTHASHAKLSLMGMHEPVPHDDSLAQYRAAFCKMSRSSVTRANSRLSRAISVVRALRAPDPGNAPTPRARNSVCHL